MAWHTRAPSRSGSETPQARGPVTKTEVVKSLQRLGDGSILRGWRFQQDKSRLQEVRLDEFFQLARKEGLLAYPSLLFTADATHITQNVTTLEELLPPLAALVSRYMHWVRANHGNPQSMHTSMDVLGRGKVDYQAFFEACKAGGFNCSEDDLVELFSGADMLGIGFLTSKDMLFFELDPVLREQYCAHLQEERSREARSYMTPESIYFEGIREDLPPTHRCALRPWFAATLERKPTLIHHRREMRKKDIAQRRETANKTFKGQLRKIHGNAIRAWRRELDAEGKYIIGPATISKACRRLNMEVDIAALWKSLDKDDDGYVRLEEMDPQRASVLASFQTWAHRNYGRCTAIWDLPETLRARASRSKQDPAWASDKKMLSSAFTEALRALEWPTSGDADSRGSLSSSLDLFGCGFLAWSDLMWLDMWRPPPWLCAEPDPLAWEDLRSSLLHHHGHLLRAWRQLLDLDDSNTVSWREFTDACSKLQFGGDIAGAWRSLDSTLSGYISMHDYDKESAKLLGSFKAWAEANFGSVRLAFKELDPDGTNQISLGKLKQKCQQLHWRGEVRLLFECLKSGSKDEKMMKSTDRRITIDEVAFLDSWPDTGDANDAEAERIITQTYVRRAASAPEFPKEPTVARSFSSSALGARGKGSMLAKDSHPFRALSGPVGHVRLNEDRLAAQFARNASMRPSTSEGSSRRKPAPLSGMQTPADRPRSQQTSRRPR